MMGGYALKLSYNMQIFAIVYDWYFVLLLYMQIALCVKFYLIVYELSLIESDVFITLSSFHDCVYG